MTSGHGPHIFEEFQPLFDKVHEGKAKAGEHNAAVKEKIESLGYRLIAEGHRPSEVWTDHQEEELYESIVSELDADGKVLYYHGWMDDGTFTTAKDYDFPEETTLIGVVRYDDGDYEFNQNVGVNHKKEVMNYLGLVENQVQEVNTDGELEWVTKKGVRDDWTQHYKAWFSDSLYIPQPYNMPLPEWLMDVIKTALKKR